jgi:porin
VLSFNHAIGDKWLVFARTGWAEDSGSLLERSVSIGGGYTPDGLELLGSGDQLGFGVNRGEPNDALFGADLDDQYAAEVYYRWQLADEIAITPSVQLLIDPALNPEDDTVWVFGLRARLAF